MKNIIITKNLDEKVVHANSDQLVAKVNNASPEELILILYQSCEQYIQQGIDFVEQKNYEQANIYIQKAERIISELRCTLNHEYEIAEQLDKLYAYMYDKLVQGNIKSNIEDLTAILNIVKELREAWESAMKSLKSKLQTNNK